MNYLEQILAFSRWKDVHPLPSCAIALWHEIMAACNKAFWPTEITVPNAILMAYAGLSRKQFERARQMLVALGLITYKKSNRVNQAGVYTVIPFPFVQKGQQNGQQKEHQKGQPQGQQEGHRKEHRRGNGESEEPAAASSPGSFKTKLKQNDLSAPGSSNNNNPPIVPPLLSPKQMTPDEFLAAYNTSCEMTVEDLAAKPKEGEPWPPNARAAAT